MPTLNLAGGCALPQIILTIMIGSLMVATSASAWSVEKSWKRTSEWDHNWLNDANWTPAGAPGAGDIVHIGDLAESHETYVSSYEEVQVAAVHLYNGGQLFASRLSIAGDLTLHSPQSLVNVGDLDAPVDLEAENIVVGSPAILNTVGATVRVRGVLEMQDYSSGLSGYGEVQFTGSGTTYQNNGWVQVNTRHLKLTQMGDGLFDLDGDGGGEQLPFLNLLQGGNLELSGSALTDDANLNVFMGDGAILDMNLANPWQMAGRLQADVHYPNPAPARITGADITLSNSIDIRTGAAIEIDANAVVTGAASVRTLGTGRLEFLKNATLHDELEIAGHVVFHGATQIEAGTYTGPGSLENAPTGEMRLADGVILDQLTVENHGLLEIGNSPGMATVNDFTNADDGTWLVEIGGDGAGTQHDLLVVTDNAMLGGTLEVALVDLGGGLFQPLIGDEFTILTAGDLSGAFLADPISLSAGKIFHWSVLTGGDAVTLRLSAITVPEPSTYALASLGAAALVFLRRRTRAKCTT